ncbi:MAG: hypothetical protein BYD32DRAFT_431582 [Podila humilis]|nr:MAG: hypothetical protein BYD32DRAFT_431582 [Podila humilis]
MHLQERVPWGWKARGFVRSFLLSLLAMCERMSKERAKDVKKDESVRDRNQKKRIKTKQRDKDKNKQRKKRGQGVHLYRRRMSMYLLSMMFACK